MRKFWKIENNINVRKSETLKSRKSVKTKIVKIRSKRKSPPRHPWRTRTEDLLIALKDIHGIDTAKAVMLSMGYTQMREIRDEHLAEIRRLAFAAI